MYELSRHRFAELKHYCMQYDEWQRLYLSYEDQSLPPPETAIPKTAYLQAMQLIETTAMDTDAALGRYILRSVTHDVSTRALNPPCDSKSFDFYRRKFFWLLSERKGV